MKRLLTIIFLTTTLLTSCGPASLPPPTTVPVTPTITPSPTQTAIPTATPYPLLQTDGPHLLFTNDDKNFTIMDANGSGREQFQLPNNGYVWFDTISPNGKWMAYFTGSTNEPYNLALNLFNLEDKTSFQIAKLIKQNFPQNLEPAIKVLRFDDCVDNEECKLSAFKFGLIQGIKSLEWSQDGRHLAFAAQIDGPSSDVYFYDLENKTVIRLTNEPENIYRITWSPNGEHVLYDTSIEGGGYTTSTIWHLVDITVTTHLTPKALSEGKPWRSLGWFNEDLYFLSTAAESLSYFDIGYIDINSRETKIIWPDIADSIVLDSENNRIVLSYTPYKINNPQIDMGTYLLYLDGTFSKISDEIFYLFPEQSSFDIYLAMDDNNSLINISPDGKITHLNQKASYLNLPRVSPDKRWTIFTSDKVIKLFSKNMQLTNSWNIDASEIIWRPDSIGAFLLTNTSLYYLSMPDGEPILIEDCAPNYCSISDYVWLP